jgi:hypothetical protein
MKVELVRPRLPDTFRSFLQALFFVGKQASPQLGRITVLSLQGSSADAG